MSFTPVAVSFAPLTAGVEDTADMKWSALRRKGGGADVHSASNDSAAGNISIPNLRSVDSSTATSPVTVFSTAGYVGAIGANV